MSDDFKIQFSFKFGPNGQDMLNVRGGSPADVSLQILGLLDKIEDAEALGARLRNAAPAAPTHDQAVATVQQAIPQATVGYDSGPVAAGGNVTYAQPQQPQAAPAQGGAMYDLADKWGNTWTYNVPGAPATPRGPAIVKKGMTRDNRPYKKWSDPAQGPEWFNQRKPKVEKHELWEGEFIRG